MKVKDSSVVRYIIVGILVYVIDIVSFIVVLKLNLLNAIHANILGRILGGTFGFFVHRSFTFKISSRQKYLRHAVKYFLILILSSSLSSISLEAFLLVVHYPIVAKLSSDIVCVALTYLISRYMIFHNKEIK